ncbi:MAG: glycosyltransferase family 4 protein [Patescibacteria group bacterium]|nr:glycosyltransferase family 4 protein [Patescibacteria group bacterium]
MKIVHLIDYFQPQVGYQETFLAKEHRKAGYDVCVVTSDRYFPFEGYRSSYFSLLGERYVGEGERNENGIRTVRLKNIEFPGTNLIYLLKLKRTLADISPDAVFCHGMYSITSYFAAKIKNELGYKLVYDTHAAGFNTQFGTFLKKAYRFFFRKFAVPLIKDQADSIFAIGEAEQDFICTEFGLNRNHVSIIRLGVDTELFTASVVKRKEIRKKMGVAADGVVCIFSGKISPRKDIETLLLAVKKINDTKIKVLLVGGGKTNHVSDLKKILDAKELIVEHFVSNDKLPDYYSAADIAVWPGDPSQGMLEAMSSSLPLIVPEWYGTEFLQKSGGVLFFKRKDIRGLAQKIAKLSYNKNKRKEIGMNARYYIGRYFSWKEIARQTLSLL